MLHEHKRLKKLPFISPVKQEMETLMYPICLNGNEPMQNSLQGRNPIFPFGSFNANKVHVSSGSNSRKRQNEQQLPRFCYADQIILRVWTFSVYNPISHNQNLAGTCLQLLFLRTLLHLPGEFFPRHTGLTHPAGGTLWQSGLVLTSKLEVHSFCRAFYAFIKLFWT